MFLVEEINKLLLKESYSFKKHFNLSDAEKGRMIAYRFPKCLVDYLNKNKKLNQLKSQGEIPTSNAHDLLNLFSQNRKHIKQLNDEIFTNFYHSNQSSCNFPDPDAPTFMSFDYLGDFRNHWIIHFTKNPIKIIKNGFKGGVKDPTRLTLTGALDDKYKSKGPKGYFFGYDLNDLGEQVDEFKKRGGAVLVKTSGAYLKYKGIDSKEAVFWGDEVQENKYALKKEGNKWKLFNQDKKTQGSGSLKDMINILRKKLTK